MGKGDKKNCFKSLVRSLEEELKNEAVHYDELEEAWIKKIPSFYVGRDDQRVDLYVDITDRLALHTALGEPSIRILECNRDPNKHYADCSYI